ncbi:hypothetical protein N9M01_11750 [Luminiphilus sp.]|nr:hypothetical protein [Luminiphilus sp.]
MQIENQHTEETLDILGWLEAALIETPSHPAGPTTYLMQASLLLKSNPHCRALAA